MKKQRHFAILLLLFTTILIIGCREEEEDLNSDKPFELNGTWVLDEYSYSSGSSFHGLSYNQSSSINCTYADTLVTQVYQSSVNGLNNYHHDTSITTTYKYFVTMIINAMAGDYPKAYRVVVLQDQSSTTTDLAAVWQSPYQADLQIRIQEKECLMNWNGDNQIVITRSTWFDSGTGSSSASYERWEFIRFND